MRIAVFTDADFDHASSLTTALGALLRHAPPDVRPRIYSLSALDVDEPEYLALRSPALPLAISGRWPLHLPRIREFERRLASDDIRAIHVSTPGPAGLTAKFLAHRTGLPLVGSLHTSGLPSGPRAARAGANGRWHLTPVWPHYLKWIYGACSKVLVPSADAVCRLTSAGWNADRLLVWPAAVDADAFSPARRSQRLRNEWHVSDRRPAILCVGPLVRGSGVGLIEPLGSLLHRQGIAHRFIVVGEGTAQADLRDACPDAVFAGRLSQRDLATVMASADLLLWPREASTAGLVLLEAQASGLPVLVASGGNARDHMRPGLTGMECHADDVLGFSARASDLLIDTARRRVMGEAARRFAQSRSWPASLDRVYAIYRAASQPGAVGVSSQAPQPVQRPVRAVRAGR
jgi:glycosyltransferase involved in cell wall biosynthesis